MRAGLVNGPRKLNTVGTPSSLRTGPTKRMAGWNRWAKQKPMPASATQRATPSGPSSMATPRASSTSAVPTDDDAARLPCLHTGTPQPATMKAARVVTLMLARRSPPVPTSSTPTAPDPGPGPSSTPSGHGTAAAIMARARPVTSSAVSPLACRRVRNAPIWAGVASPAKTTPMVSSASDKVSGSRRDRRARTSGQLSATARARSVPPEVAVENAAGDEPELPLGRALDDRHLLGVAVPLLGRVVLHVAGGAEQLHGQRRGAHGQLGGVVLGHREVRDVLLGELAGIGQHGGPVGQQPGRLEVDGALGDLPLDALEVRNRLAEGGPLLHVLGGVHERSLGQADAAGGHDRAHGVEAEHGQAEAAPLADDVLRRHVDIGQEQLTGVDPLDAHLVVGAADVHAVAGALDDEGGHRVMGP